MAAQLGLNFNPRLVGAPPAGTPPHAPGKRGALCCAAVEIMALLSDGRAHSRLELQAVGGNRYAARIAEMRDMGHVILGPMPQPRRGITAVEPMAGGLEMYRLVAPQ